MTNHPPRICPVDLGHEASVVINVEHEGRSVSGYLANLLRRWSGELAKAECILCRQHGAPRKIPRREMYGHRIPTGKYGSLHWHGCRASDNWRTVELLTQSEENWEASAR